MIKLDTSYSDYVDETDSNYPNGKAIDCSTDESFDGTPILKELVNDVKGALESVVYAAEKKLSGVSGVPDNIAASDFLNALKKLIETPDKAHADLRGPNAHGATVSASASQIITRDSAGRAQVSSPAVAADIANKGWTEDQIGGMAESLVNGDVDFAGKKTFNGSVEMNGPVGGTGFENRLAEKVDPPTEVTKAQYDAMTPEQKAGKYWIITDATGFNQPVIRDDLKAKDTVWSSDKTDSTINNALANYNPVKSYASNGESPLVLIAKVFSRNSYQSFTQIEVSGGRVDGKKGRATFYFSHKDDVNAILEEDMSNLTFYVYADGDDFYLYCQMETYCFLNVSVDPNSHCDFIMNRVNNTIGTKVWENNYERLVTTSNLAGIQTKQHFIIDEDHSAQFTMGNWSSAIIAGMSQGYGGFGEFLINQVDGLSISDIGSLHFEISNKIVTVTGSGGRNDLYVLYLGGFGE